MARDHRKLDVLHLADRLVLEIYKATADMPMSERFGLQSQVRRGAVSVPANIVEGSSRPTDREYARFITVAHGSSRECEYLIDLNARLGYVNASTARRLSQDYNQLSAMLLSLTRAISPQ